MRRRDFLQNFGIGSLCLPWRTASGAVKCGAPSSHPRELEADLVIVGGGTGGCAAAE